MEEHYLSKEVRKQREMEEKLKHLEKIKRFLPTLPVAPQSSKK